MPVTIKRMLSIATMLAMSVTVTQARELKPYTADPTPPPLTLKDIHGKVHDLALHRGKVLLVNFWATWCPPCRVEMPSMWRLKDKLRKQPFEIIAVDMAEDLQTVTTFLPDKMEKDFIVLLDSKGQAQQQWRVFAYPTSFVIDKKGKIRYALYGAKEWDEPDVMTVIQPLLKE